MSGGNFFHREDLIRPLFAELLLVLCLDEFGERQFPGLVCTIGITAEPFWAQTEFSRHLNMRIGKSKLFAGIDPRQELVGNPLFFRHGCSSNSV